MYRLLYLFFITLFITACADATDPAPENPFTYTDSDLTTMRDLMTPSDPIQPDRVELDLFRTITRGKATHVVIRCLGNCEKIKGVKARDNTRMDPAYLLDLTYTDGNPMPSPHDILIPLEDLQEDQLFIEFPAGDVPEELDRAYVHIMILEPS